MLVMGDKGGAPRITSGLGGVLKSNPASEINRYWNPALKECFPLIQVTLSPY